MCVCKMLFSTHVVCVLKINKSKNHVNLVYEVRDTTLLVVLVKKNYKSNEVKRPKTAHFSKFPSVGIVYKRGWIV